MTALNDANAGYPYGNSAGYDPTGHQGNVVPRMINIQTDSSVSPAIVYGDMAVDVAVTTGPPTDITATGTISADQGAVTATLGQGAASWSVEATGTFSAGTTLFFEFQLTSSGAWYPAFGVPIGSTSDVAASSVAGGAATTYQGNAAGFQAFRVRAHPFQGGDSVTIKIVGSVATDGGFVSKSLPPGSNVIGTVNSLHASAVDATNSSTALLTANSAFTGTAQSSLNYSALSVEVFADQASAAGGLSIQQSQDGTHWDTIDTFTISASANFQTTVNLIGSKYRVVYTNGGTNQGTFRLQTIAQTQDVVLPRTLDATGNLKVAAQNANANGQALMSASSPVVPASDYIAPTRSVMAEFIGVAPTGANQDVVASIDTLTAGYRHFAIQVTGTFTATLQVLGCNDNANFVNLGEFFVTAGSGFSTTITAAGVLSGPIPTRYIKVRCTAFTSNTSMAVTLELSTASLVPSAMDVQQIGTWTVMPGNTQNTTPWLTQGAKNNSTAAANAGTGKAIKASAGALWSVVVTALGTAATTLYDNASAASGTALLTIPANAAVGTIYSFPGGAPAANGIFADQAANAPSITIYYQ